MKRLIFILILIALSLSYTPAIAAISVVYENATTPGSGFLSLISTGGSATATATDDITLGGTARRVTAIYMPIYSDLTDPGTVDVQVRFLDGATVLWDSGVIQDMPFGQGDNFHLFRINPSDASASVLVPNTFTVEITLSDAQSVGNYDLGLPNFGPPTVGSSVNNLGARIFASQPTAKFNSAPDPTVSFKINFTASGCPGGDTCTYTWDFGQPGGVTTGAGTATPTHTYTDGIGKVVILNMTDTTSGETFTPAIRSVLPVRRSNNVAPVAANTIGGPPTYGGAVAGFIVTFIDTSSDDGVFPTCVPDGLPAISAVEAATCVVVNWGNGTFSAQQAGSTFTKNYYDALKLNSGAGSFNIMMTVPDAEGLKSTIIKQVTVPTKYQVSGKVVRLDGTTPVGNASVRLMLAGGVVKMAATNSLGNFVMTNVAPGNYTVRAIKTGLTFADQPADATLGSVTGVLLTGDR